MSTPSTTTTAATTAGAALSFVGSAIRAIAPRTSYALSASTQRSRRTTEIQCSTARGIGRKGPRISRRLTHLAELALEHFAGRRLRQGIEHDEPSRVLEGCQPFAAVGNELVGGGYAVG